MWQLTTKKQKYKKISKKKMSTPVEVLCKGYPSECGGRKKGAQFSRGRPQHNDVCGIDELLCVVWIDCTFEAKAHVGLNNYRTIQLLPTVEMHSTQFVCS